jgi:hypothetical protein
MLKLCFSAFLLILAGCDHTATPASLTSCRVIAQAAPTTANIPVGASITVVATREAACPAPLLRNETPAVLQVDSIAPSMIRVTGRAVGEGRLRIRSGVDTLVSMAIPVTVTP